MERNRKALTCDCGANSKEDFQYADCDPLAGFSKSFMVFSSLGET